jgi:hypothetical protein
VSARNDVFEAEAQRVLQGLLGGAVVPKDVPPVQGMRDFDLVNDVGEVVHAVEVTSVQLGSVRATRAGIDRLRDLDLGLSCGWSLTVHESAQVRPIERGAAPLLNQLRDRGVSRFDSMHPPDDPGLALLISRLGDLGVADGRALSTGAPKRLFLAAWGSGSLDPSNVTSAVEERLDAEDNQRKLAAAPAGAVRHLFVWLDDSHWYVSSLLRDREDELPPVPDLPAMVDVVWIAIGDGDPFRCSGLLRADARGIVELDPATGAEVRRHDALPLGGPPEQPPSCPECQAPGVWSVAWVTRVDPKTQARDQIPSWEARCSQVDRHWAAPGRALSRRERREHGVGLTA